MLVTIAEIATGIAIGIVVAAVVLFWLHRVYTNWVIAKWLGL